MGAGLSFPLPWNDVNPFLPAQPSQLSPVLGTAYQATDPSRPSVISLMLMSMSTNSLLDSSQSSQKGEVWIGNSAAAVTGSSGSKVAQHENTQGGVLVVGLSITQKIAQTVLIVLPIGWFYCIKQTLGNAMSVAGAYEQAAT